VVKQRFGDQLDQTDATPTRQVVAVRDHAAEVLIRRAAHLDPADRLLITTAVATRLSYRRLAELFRQPLGTLSRRLKRIGKLLIEPHIAQLLDGPCHHLDATDRQIAIGYFLKRQSHKQLARQHHMTPRQVSQRIEYFRGWMRGANARGKPEGRNPKFE
jgi:hypothetical protein